AAAKDRPQIVNGVEQWFDPDTPRSYENRRETHQLLSADMLAWTIATVRARELTLRGRWEEMMQVAKLFASTGHIKMGYTSKETFKEWEKEKLDEAAQKQPGISKVRSNDGGTTESSPQRDQKETRSGESGEEETESGEEKTI